MLPLTDDSNALKFTPNGGHIQVKAHFIPAPAASSESVTGKLKRLPSMSRISDISDVDKCGKIRIEFLDTGPGISEVTTAHTCTVL